ncbi:MAG TPA: FlgD immunoglobulin-like domain containing protein, partial [Rhodothermales bacterium]|nr:FlgD immunoglobulin-like domain containing protein [Rhodothermales bacterium]
DLLDWDSDGDTDLLASGHEEATGSRPARLYLNENGRFSMYHEVIHYEDMSFAPGDFDRDGDVDLFATGFNPEALGLVTPTATFWIKWGHFSNAAPTPPANLSSTVDGGRVELNWSAATDDKTVSPALTYNVRVGTQPGGVDVMSPLSHPQTGTRYVCAPGNVFHNLRWPLRSLPPGTYYWSVQAVDQSCVGSSFSPERTFVVTGTSESLNAGNDELPSILSIQHAHPNPFGDRTTLSYTLQNALEVELSIFDVLGRRVRTIASGLIPAGSHAAVWDGLDTRGMPTASGIYVYRLRSNRRAISGTVILTR